SSNEKCNTSSTEAGKRSGKRESAGSAFGWILLRQPQRVYREIGASQAEKKQTYKEPGEPGRSQIVNLAKGDHDKHHHQHTVKGKRTAAAKSPRKHWHQNAAQNGCEGNQHSCVRGQLRRFRPVSPAGFRKGCDRGRNVNRSRP